MDLIGAGQIIIGGGDDRPVGFLQLIQSRLKPGHSDSTQIDDIVTLRGVIGTHKGAHHFRVFKKNVRVRDDLGTKIIRHCVVGHLPALLCFFAN